MTLYPHFNLHDSNTAKHLHKRRPLNSAATAAAEFIFKAPSIHPEFAPARCQWPDSAVCPHPREHPSILAYSSLPGPCYPEFTPGRYRWPDSVVCLQCKPYTHENIHPVSTPVPPSTTARTHRDARLCHPEFAPARCRWLDSAACPHP